ncbi:MAG: general secretion pathway protein GspC [Leptospiraceae bacterium]|nr:general secretion pathway protein GspC [Leptospiraceae bacterium]
MNLNSILLKLQKHQFLVLIPFVLFLSFALAYALRVGILAKLPSINTDRVVRKLSLTTTSSNLKPVNSYEETVVGNFIRGALPSAETSASEGKLEQVQVVNEEFPGADDYLLTGTLSGNPKFARATFKPKDKDEADEYAIGEKVAGYTVKGIYNHYAVLFKNGMHIKIEIGETIAEGKKRVLKPEKEGKEEVAGNLPPGGCTLTKKIISRTDFERTLKNPNDIYKDARFGPNLVDGKIDGYKLFQIPVTHVFYALGARNGDIVKRVNGFPLAETEKMLELWANIKNSTKVVIDVDRKGKCLTYEFTIRN